MLSHRTLLQAELIARRNASLLCCEQCGLSQYPVTSVPSLLKTWSAKVQHPDARVGLILWACRRVLQTASLQHR